MTLKEKMNLIEKNIEYSMNNRQRIFYSNGYGMSYIPDFNDITLYEVAVLKGTEESYDICYSTYITSDVLKGLTLDEVKQIGEEISKLNDNNRSVN